jgi:hypothetical protein
MAVMIPIQVSDTSEKKLHNPRTSGQETTSWYAVRYKNIDSDTIINYLETSVHKDIVNAVIHGLKSQINLSTSNHSI